MEVERGLALTCRRLFGEPSPLLSIGRFRLLRSLGHGGHGSVYEAFDPLRHRLLALKLLHDAGPAALYALKREFRALADLTHPNMVALHELYVEPHVAYFTMELVVGSDFLSYATACGRQTLIDALLQLCRGLSALHAAGKLHRDLKPDNVLVTHTGRVVLADFGLVTDAGAPQTSTCGTHAYLAPEQRAGRACESSDLYSLGVLLAAVLRARRAAGQSYERELEHLALRLTAASVRERPAHQQLMAALVAAAGEGRRFAVEPEREPASRRPPPAQLSALAAAFERSRRTPSAVVIRGEAGADKTALLAAFASFCCAADALVLRGRCHARESVSFKALDAVVDALSEHLVSLPAASRAALGPRNCGALIAAFPVLGRIPHWAESATARSARDLGVLGAQLRELLRRLARARPLVLLLEDVQWSDRESARLLASTWCHPAAPPLLLIMTERVDRRAESSALSAFADLRARAIAL